LHAERESDIRKQGLKVGECRQALAEAQTQGRMDKISKKWLCLRRMKSTHPPCSLLMNLSFYTAANHGDSVCGADKSRCFQILIQHTGQFIQQTGDLLLLFWRLLMLCLRTGQAKSFYFGHLLGGMRLVNRICEM